MSNFSFGGLLPGWLELIVFIYWTFTIILLIMDDREPSITLAWLFILIFLPLIGVFFYIFFGRDWKVVAQRKGWIQTLKRVETEEMAPIYERNAGAGERFEREWAGTIAVPVSRAIASENVSTVLPAASVELFVTGKAKFARLKEDLAGAQRFIHLQYFIWEQDRLTAEIVPILLDRLAAGVEVRIMYDWMGCISFKKREFKQLAKAGATVRADVTDLERGPPRPHGGHRPGREVGLDPVAILRPRLQHLRRDDQRRPQRHRRALHDDRRPRQARPLLRRADLLPQAHRGRRQGVPVRGRLLPLQDDRRRRDHQRRRDHEHGPAQPQAAQGAHVLGVRQGLRAAVRRRVPRRHGELPRSRPRRRAHSPPPEEVPQPGGPALLRRALRRLAQASCRRTTATGSRPRRCARGHATPSSSASWCWATRRR